VLDGGTGSELRRRGVTFVEDCWSAAANLSDSETLTAIHRDYLHAGADIVTANTFATSRFVLAGAGLDSQWREINIAAIAAARRAISDPFSDTVVAASLSCLAPRFDPNAFPSAAVECAAYAELADLFADQAVDLLLLEMMQDTVHAKRACRAARASGLSFWLGLSCRVDQETSRLVAFDDPATPLERVVESLLPFEPTGIAIMHSPVGAVAPALAMLRRYWLGPLGAYAEIPYAEDPASSSKVEPITPSQYATTAAAWIAAGVTLVGGCCGTSPAHVAALRRRVDAADSEGTGSR
jgi:S-methylmethionine-dependent homocysteine/selenocysteine methylase